MKSKHCPYKSSCLGVGTCETCAHGKQYDRMGTIISGQRKTIKRLKAEIQLARRALTNYPGDSRHRERQEVTGE